MAEDERDRQVIKRYADPPKDFEPVPPASENLDAVTDHITRHLGEPQTVFHELISDAVHIDVHHVAPRPDRPFHSLVTSGMSDRPMAFPPGQDEFALAELCAFLPAEWPVSQEAFADEANYWPVRTLKFLARFPHKFSTFLSWGHSIPNFDPPEPYAPNTKLCGTVLVGPGPAPEAFAQLHLDGTRRILFFQLLPVHAAEMDYKLKHGADALLERVLKAGWDGIIRPDRPDSCRKRFLFF